jgi:hypothetical protein
VKTSLLRAFPGFLLFFCLSGTIHSQRAPSKDLLGGSYLIPQTVFVGDRARLVVPLDGAFLQVPPLVIRDPVFPSPGEDLKINRIELEHRGGIPRLLIDFIAYAPGVLTLPPIEIPLSGALEASSAPSASFLPGYARFTDLRLTVASILDGETLVLSPPAPSLAVPGTALMIYGTVAALIVLTLGIIGGRRRFGDWLRRWGAGWRRRRLIVLLRNMLRRFKRNLLRAGPGLSGTGELLDRVSGEFRTFLSLFTGINCRAFTAGEFPGLSLLDPPGEGDPRISGSTLGDLFRRWDALRFSGKDIAGEELLSVLDELLGFLSVLEEAERRRDPRDASGSARSGSAGSPSPAWSDLAGSPGSPGPAWSDPPASPGPEPEKPAGGLVPGGPR